MGIASAGLGVTQTGGRDLSLGQTWKRAEHELKSLSIAKALSRLS